MIETLVIPITITAIVLLLLWIVFHCSKVHWTLKLLTCLLTGFLSIFVWNAIQEVKGWPVDDELPLKYRFHGAHVVEPSAKNGLGTIYITASDISTKYDDVVTIAGFGILKKEPRIYKIPYDRESHKQAQEYQKEAAEGQAVILQREEKKENEASAGSNSPKVVEGDGGGEAPREGNETGQKDESVKKLGKRVPAFSHIKK